MPEKLIHKKWTPRAIHEELKKIQRESEETFSTHKIRTIPSKAWLCAGVTEAGRRKSPYWFKISWAPGVLTVSGDIDEVIFTHQSGLATLSSTLKWLHGIDFDYLMSKSNAKKELDNQQTLIDIIGMANQDAQPDFAAILREYASTKPVRQVALKRMGLWYRIYENFKMHLDRSLADLGPNILLYGWGRRLLKEQVWDHIRDFGPESIAEFLRDDLEIEDYYGAEKWPHRCHLWFAAVKKWASEVSTQQHIIKEAVDGMASQADGMDPLAIVENLNNFARQETITPAEKERYLKMAQYLLGQVVTLSKDNDALRKLLPGEVVAEEKRLALP